ncbi:hypothetical protein C8J57DRAFT_1056355 [Mycena rebaudengoi]|nr:hypothetical protein C8J57DRAFT_1056355 [Mycena rebaudengoi]
MIDPALYTPSKRMRMMTSALGSTSSGSFLVSQASVTSLSSLPAPVLEGPPALAQPDWSQLEVTDENLGAMTKSQLLEAAGKMRANLALARQHEIAGHGRIESAHGTIVLQNLFVEKQSQALNKKENKKKTNHTKLSMGGMGRHLTAPEWIEKTAQAAREREEEAAAKVQRAGDQEVAKAVKEAREKRWKEIQVEHTAAVSAWEERCKQLLAEGCKRKDLPKKPVQEKKPKPPVVEKSISEPEDDDTDTDNE